MTDATTLENTQTTSGLVIARNPLDAQTDVAYQITNVIGGTLYLSDGVTAIGDGNFIPAALGAAGLKFTPAKDSTSQGSFTVQASTTGDIAGLSGSLVTATITILSPLTVTNTADTGPGSLRQAILDANVRNDTANTIQFQLLAGSEVINLFSPLPTATAPLTCVLDATQNVTVVLSSVTTWNDNTSLTLSGAGSLTIIRGIDGSGNLTVDAGSNLAASHIVQNALLIGGTSGNPATVTIAASDALGNPNPAPAPTTMTLGSVPTSLTSGQSVNLAAAVSSFVTPNEGTVTFLLNGTTSLGSAPVSGGTAMLSKVLPTGIDLITASYSDEAGNFAASSTTVGPSSIITTVAGGGSPGDNGPATSAQLNSPADVVVDTAGDIFIADTNNNRIREVNHATGVISTVAGIGTPGFSGDNSLATSAELSSPFGIALNAAGDIFIADMNNNRIREVNHTTGVITTVAGNGSSGFSGDNGLAISAELSSPFGIALNAAGDLFIADMNNNRIREVNHSTGVITTIAGNGTDGFSGDNGPATAAQVAYPEDHLPLLPFVK